jgi:transposase
MKNKPPQSGHRQPALFIGIDWADQKHDTYTIDQQGRGVHETIEHTPEAIESWVTTKLQQAGGQPIGIILEQTRGALIHALMFRENVILFPINPKQFARYRESYSNAGCKDDATDARLLARMLRERHLQLKPWEPDDEATRLLGRLCQSRRQLVNECTRTCQQLIEQLKAYFPLVLELNSGRSVSPLVLELVRRWPDPRQLQRADRRILHKVLKGHGYRSDEKRQEIIERIRSAKLLSRDRALIEPAAVVAKMLARQLPVLQNSIEELNTKIEAEMKRHPDAALFQALPGAGDALAPRLLTAFGSRRDRFASADEIATFSGIAPVTRQSGKSRIVHRRYACPKYLRQTFHEFADHARKWCPWSKAYYKLQRSRGMKHHAAVRKLASRWIRILFRVWKDRSPYDPDAYLATIKQKNPAIIPFLPTTTK